MTETKSYALCIPRDMQFDIPCPSCHRRDQWYQVTIYLDHETRKCKACGNEWIKKYEHVGERFIYEVSQKTTALEQLTNEIIGQFVNKRGSLTKKEQEKVLIGLSYLRRQLQNFIKEIQIEDDPSDEDLELRTFSTRCQDFPYLFRKTYQERVYQGVAFFPSKEECVRAAKRVRMRLSASSIAITVKATLEYPERYLAMLPRDPESELEKVLIEQAREVIKKLSETVQLASATD